MRKIESDYELLNKPDELRERVQGTTDASDIADEIDATNRTVANWVLFHDIEPPESWHVNTESEIDVLNDTERLRSMIVDDTMSIPSMADELDIRKDTVKRWLIRHGINERAKREPDTSKDPRHNHHYGKLSEAAWAQTDVAWREPEQLIRAYWGFYWSTNEIADWAEYGPSRGLITDIMKENDIPIRDASEANTIRGLKQHGADVTRLREEVPPPVEMAEVLHDMGIEVYGDVPRQQSDETTVEWSRLSTAGADD